MPESFAEPSDLESRWQPLSDQEQQLATTLLGAASRIIRREFPNIDAAIDADRLDKDIPVDVACWMVKRAMRPSTGEQDAAYSDRVNDLFLTDSDRSLLEGTGTSSSAGPLPRWCFS